MSKEGTIGTTLREVPKVVESPKTVTFRNKVPEFCLRGRSEFFVGFSSVDYRRLNADEFIRTALFASSKVPYACSLRMCTFWVKLFTVSIIPHSSFSGGIG